MEKTGKISALELDGINFALGQNFIILGTDAYLIEQAIAKIKSDIRAKENVDIISIYADEVRNKASLLAEHLDTFTIFSESKIVIVKNCEELLKKELEVLAAYFEAPPENQSLIVVVEKYDARTAVWKKISGGCTIILADAPRFSSEIKLWLQKALRKQARSMNAAALEEFSARIELDYYYAANELDKLLLLTEGKTQITAQDVQKSLGTTRTGTRIDFLRALGRKDAKTAIERLEQMLAADFEPLQVFFQIYSYYQNLYRINLHRKARIPNLQIVQKYMSNIFQSQRNEYLNFAKGYTLRSLEKIFKILLDTDTQLKTSTIDANLALNICVIKIMEA